MTTADVLKPDFATQRKHFIFTDDHQQLRESIRRFVIKELQPHAEEWEETTFPDWVFERMGELGFLGLDKSEQYGGQGGDYYSSLVLAEELVHAHSGGLAMGVAVQTDMAMPPILAFGTEDQKQQWVVPKYVASTTLGEPLPWPNSTLLRGDTVDALRALKAQSGGVLAIMGSGVLIGSLIAADLIDEYVLMIHPLVLGTGRRLFPAGVAVPLRLTDSVTSAAGVVIATYEPARD